MTPMLEWILQRGQVDFGNLAVGIGTALLACASFRSVQHARQQQDRHEATAWRESLRTLLGKYHATCFRFSNLRREVSMENRKRLGDPESKSLYAEMLELKSQIMLMLDENKEEHQPLLDHCNQLQNAAFEGTTISAQKLTETARIALRA